MTEIALACALNVAARIEGTVSARPRQNPINVKIKMRRFHRAPQLGLELNKRAHHISKFAAGTYLKMPHDFELSNPEKYKKCCRCRFPIAHWRTCGSI